MLLMADSSTLGPLPWSQDQLRMHPRAARAIRQHPGYPAHRDLEALRVSREIFDESVGELVAAIRGFHDASAAPGFWGRRGSAEFELRVREVRRRTFTASTAALAWRDHAVAVNHRSLNRGFAIPDWSMRWQALKAPETHQFLATLRHCISHAVPMTPEWQVQLNFASADRQTLTRFLLHREDLLECARWTGRARIFIENNPNGIDVEELFLRHAIELGEFNEWLSATVSALSEPALSDYRRYATVVKRVAARNAWQLLLQIASPESAQKYLTHELSEEELAEIEALPPRSRARADRVIEILDTEGACTDDLRQRAYKALGAIDDRQGD